MHADAARGGLPHELVEIRERAELGMHRAVVGDVVAPVVVGTVGDRVQPDAVDTQPHEVIELAGDAAEVADAVAVRVAERARVDLVQDAVAPPHCVLPLVRFAHRSGSLPSLRTGS